MLSLLCAPISAWQGLKMKKCVFIFSTSGWKFAWGAGDLWIAASGGGGEDDKDDDDDHYHNEDGHVSGFQVCGGLAGAAVRAEGLGSSSQLQGSKSETFAMLGAVRI